jgi:hypothetical protein
LTKLLYVAARTAANVSTVLAKVTLFDANVPKMLSLGAGVFSIDVLIYDAWGATTVFTIPTTVTVIRSFGLLAFVSTRTVNKLHVITNSS